MLGQVLYPVFRRVDFRGKGRLRARLPVPREGRPVVTFPGGAKMRLDLRESLQRDFYFGLYDQFELRLMSQRLTGDVVDVGAHIGLYTVRAARELGTRGRVLAFEPNPSARAQLEENVALNGCANVVVSDAAVGEEQGSALLHVPSTDDPSFSSLEPGRFAEGDPLDVAMTTIDAAVAEHGLRPSFVKVDVEGGEVDVVRGAASTIAEHRPTLLVEVNERSVNDVRGRLPRYRAQRIAGRRLVDVDGGRGLFNVLFSPA